MLLMSTHANENNLIIWGIKEFYKLQNFLQHFKGKKIIANLYSKHFKKLVA
jgi:hypothetical protein